MYTPPYISMNTVTNTPLYISVTVTYTPQYISIIQWHTQWPTHHCILV